MFKKLLSHKIKFLFLIFFIFLFRYFYISVRVDKSFKEEDAEIAKFLNVEKHCSNIYSYLDEINCIKSVQDSQLKMIEGRECRGKFVNAGSIEFISANTGCCYDRSRLMEKVLQYYGFKVRHVTLIQTSNIGFLGVFIPSNSGHSATEVLTSKGWLGVDSEDPFILIDANNEPYNFKQGISNGMVKSLTKRNFYFYKKPIVYIIGLYSRNGTFYEPYIPFIPEINFMDLIRNISKIQVINPA